MISWVVVVVTWVSGQCRLTDLNLSHDSSTPKLPGYKEVQGTRTDRMVWWAISPTGHSYSMGFCLVPKSSEKQPAGAPELCTYARMYMCMYVPG